MAAVTGRRDATEAEIQKAIMMYLATRRGLVFWRQNSGSFVAPVIRAVAAVLEKFRIGRKKHSIIAAIKKTMGHYKCASETGLPDITVIYRGVYLGVEVKTKKGRLTKDQKLMHKRMEKAGVRVIIARSVDDVKAALSDIDSAFSNAKRKD